MAIQKFVLDDAFDEIDYTLIGIHCSLEDYRLAYLINQCLGISLKRRKTDLDYNNGETAYSIYEWDDEKQLTTWSLVSNIYKTAEFQSRNFESLFDTQEKIIKTFHLLPEHKTVNFLLKIDSVFSLSKEKYLVESILKIDQIATAYSLDPNKLKYKEHLIFS